MVPIESLIDFIRSRIREEWCDPAETMSYDSREGGYLGDICDAEDLFYKLGLDISNDRLRRDLVSEFDGHPWCAKDWELLAPSERWIYGWELFQHVVKHRRRYSFWYDEGDIEEVNHPDHLPPSGFLAEIGGTLQQGGLLKTVPAGIRVWRVRDHEVGRALELPKDLTAPPVEHARQPNRFSPPGIPMFYAADEFETACLEVTAAREKSSVKMSVSGVQFRNMIPLNILDLTSVPALPSYFSQHGPRRRHVLTFLKKFAADISLPIRKDGVQHIEYVPTQVFTEFVRYILKIAPFWPIHGMKYSSSRDGKPSWVIFANQAECLPHDAPLDFVRQILQCIPESFKTVPVS